MFKSNIFLLLFLFSHFFARAQQLIPLDEAAYLQQITRNISSTNNDSIKISNHLLLSEYWAPTDSSKSKKALNQAIQLSKKQRVDEGIINYYKANLLAQQNDKKQAIKLLEQSIKWLKKNQPNHPLLVKAYYNLAYWQVDDKGYDFMVKTLTNYCIPLSKKINHTELLAYSYTQLGLTFMSVGQFSTAEDYHKKALAELNQLPSKNTVHLLTYFNLVSNNCYKPDSKTAKIYLEKATELIAKYPTSLHYPNYYYQQAMYYTTTEKYNMALQSLDKGAELAKANNQTKLVHMLYFRKYNVFLMLKDYKKAKAQLEFILSENILNKEPLNRRTTFSQLAAVNDVLGQHKEAYEWMKKSATLGDSLQQSKLIEKMNELDILHQTNEKQQKIDYLELEHRKKELLDQKKNLRIALLALALILSVVILFLIFRSYKKQKQLNHQININHQQELLSIENERKYEATQAILQGEEQERQRIAQDLHDSMGGMLANIRMSLSKDSTPNREELIQKLDKSIVEMRRISRNLMPETLKNLGLEIALKELCEAMSHPKFHIQFEAYDLSHRIPFNKQLALYRIAQESISNALKYAQTDHVIVQISQNNSTIHLTIEDEGIGFNPAETLYGLGIKNIRNRAELINGTVSIISEEGKGTTINIECHA